MKRTILVMLTVLVFFMGFGAIGQEQKVQSKKSSDEDEISSDKQLVMKPVMTKQQELQLKKVIAKAKEKGCKDNFPAPIAVSVYGSNHVSGGSDTLLFYSNVVTNEGGAWNNNSAFIAPCNGLYFFSINFVKDSYYHNGTTDDVRIYLTKNLSTANVGIGAWAGEGGGNRGTGAFSIILRLNGGDWIQTWAHSDGGPQRHISSYNFTAHRISD